MKPSIYPIVAKYPGRLFIMPKPSGEWLRDDLSFVRQMKVDLLVSMLEPAEVQELGLHLEKQICADCGLDFINFPIPDRGLPDHKKFDELVQVVRHRLLGNQGVAVHCRAGIGRSAMLVCAALAGFIETAEKAVEVVSDARGVTVPDTREQLAFIRSFVEPA